MGSNLHRYTIDGLGRVYSNGDDLWLPSVSTVLDVRETPQELANWKQRKKNAGEYESTMSYKQNRGTLIHEACLQQIVPDNPDSGEPKKVIWGKEENNSTDGLKENGNYDRYEDDEEWALESWEYLKTIMGIGPDNEGGEVIDVETFVTNTDIGYAGQFDLLYRDTDTGENVLADIKTSANAYDKHQIQLSAYAMAVAMPIHRLEILRMNPGQKDWEVFGSDRWQVPRDDLEGEFIRLRDKLESQNLETIIETIKERGRDAEGVVYEEMADSVIGGTGGYDSNAPEARHG